MDDSANGAYSRAPEFEDVIKLCAALNRHGAKYILIGGFAVVIHGFGRTTKDIDFLVDASPENIAKVKQALAILSDNAVAQIQDEEVAKYSVVRVADEVVVDLLAKACGIDYQQAIQHVDYIEIDGVRIPVANPEILIRMKNTIRPSDKMDIDFLKALLAEIKKK